MLIFRVVDKGLSKYIRHSLGLLSKRETHFPQLLYVDEKTGDITKYEMDFISDSQDEIGRLNVKAEYNYLKIRGVSTFIPTSIIFSSSTDKFVSREIFIKNILFKPE